MYQPIAVTFENQVLQVAPETKIVELLDERRMRDECIVGAKVNNKVVSLTYKLRVDATLEVVTPKDELGHRIYIDSLVFMLTYCFWKQYPDKRLVISHSLSEGIYFYLHSGEEVPEEMITVLNEAMRDAVNLHLPIETHLMDKDTALATFAHDPDSNAFLSYTYLNSILVASIKGHKSIGLTSYASNTELLNHFQLTKYRDGMLLRHPARKIFPEFSPFEDQKQLFDVYKQQLEWESILGFETVGALNDAIVKGRALDIALITESLQNKRILDIIDQIRAKGTTRIVLIAGPSSSGKTTFSKKLQVYLQSEAMPAWAISLDNYFVNREDNPVDENGDLDFEALEALDVEGFNRNLLDILEGRPTELPTFDFKTGRRADEVIPYVPTGKEIIIIEGIHGLNPRLTYAIDPQYLFKIYISPLTQVNITDSIRIPTTIARLYRRLVRDNRYRGYSAEDNLSRWPSVRAGEEKNIYPHQWSADAYFNSSMPYELSVLRPFVEPMLKSVPPSSKNYPMANYLMDFILHFLPIPQDLVPNTSILREFIGGALYLQVK
jgi:uridine kinase